ncbi:MAG: hypothetical protein D6705_05700 [Deltaproteobacteria bacterium]|nr:MAG: hypothetical protein D6705_05700 [Deltaproteobacteria bacterium]
MDCIQTQCSAELVACQMDVACACWAQCLNNGGTEPACQMQCGDPPQTLDDVATCVDANCGQVCN